MPCAAMRAIVVARAGPFVDPSPLAAGAPVEIQKPGHASLLGSQTVISPRNEINKSAIAQILKLLTNLGFDILVAGIEFAKMPFESVDLVERESGFLDVNSSRYATIRALTNASNVDHACT